jgi:WD40 repeat protein
MRVSPFHLLLAIALIFALAGTAAAEKILTITSDPPGATVSINGQVAGVTPIQEKVKEFWFNGPKYLWSEFLNQPLQMTVGKEGYEPQTITITSGPYRWVNLNNTAEKIYYVIAQTSYHVVLRKIEAPREQPREFVGSGPLVTPSSAATFAAPTQTAQAADRQQPELVVSAGHGASVSALAFSPDERVLASGDGAGVIKLWGGMDGSALGTLVEPGFLAKEDGSVMALAFSPDGRVLASVTSRLVDTAEQGGTKWMSEINFWDVASGSPLGVLKDIEGQFFSIAFSPDGSVLAAGKGVNPLLPRGSENGVVIWEVKGGRELARLPSASVVGTLAFLGDGAHLLAGNWGAGFKVWELPGGRSKDIAGSPLFMSALAQPARVDFNAAAKKFAAAIANDAKTLSVIDASDMSLKKELRWGAGFHSVKFSPSGRALACGSSEGGVKIWDAGSWAERSEVKPGTSSGVIAMSPNSKVLAYTAESGKAVKLWDLNDETTMRVFGGDAGHKDEITALAFSPDSRTLASGSDDATVKLWDVETGRVKTLTGHTTSIKEVAFSPDGRVLATVATYDESEDDLDKSVRFWDVASGAALKTITPSSPPQSLSFSPDGALLAIGNTDKTISVYNAVTGRLTRTLAGLNGEVDWVIFINERTLQSFSMDDSDNPEIKLWNVASGELLSTVTDKTTDPSAVMFMGGNMGGALAVSDKLYAYPLPGGGLDLFSKSSTRMIDFSPQSEVAKLYLFGDDDWLITTPEGLFDGTPGGWKHANWRFGGNTFDNSALELYFRDFFHPNLLQEIIAGKTPKPPAGLDLAKVDRRQPSVLISEINGEANPGFEGRRAAGFRTDKRVASVTLTVADNVEEPKQPGKAATSGAQDLRLFRNGSLVRIWRGDLFGLSEGDGCAQLAPSKQGEPRRVRCRADVSVVAGNNEFTAYAFNGEKVKSEDSVFPVGGEDTLKRGRTLYVLAVGVGQYENPGFNLKYTVRDAQDFGEEVRRQQEAVGFYQKVEVIPLLDQSARKDFILSALNTLKEAAQPEDGLIIYFSGHGVARGERFYLLPSDIGYKGPRSALDDAAMRTILAHGISDLELESALTGIDAGRILLVIDACHSGKALQADDERRGPMDTNGLGQLAYEKGMYVLTASQGEEVAYESAALKHSYLTYALVEEGLKANEADADGDGQLLLGEWLEYAKRRVPRMRQGQTPGTAPRPNKSLEEAGAVEEGLVQQPRVFYRREPELQPFVVAKPGGRAPARSAKEGAR